MLYADVYLFGLIEHEAARANITRRVTLGVLFSTVIFSCSFGDDR
jgi:hypothetical protein